MSIFFHQTSAARRPARQRVQSDDPASGIEIETLFASDQAAAIERILDDVTDSTETDVADRILPPLRQTLCTAFLTGEEHAWRTVYRHILTVVSECDSRSTPAFQRLRAFVAENEDLAEQL